MSQSWTFIMLTFYMQCARRGYYRCSGGLAKPLTFKQTNLNETRISKKKKNFSNKVET